MAYYLYLCAVHEGTERTMRRESVWPTVSTCVTVSWRVALVATCLALAAHLQNVELSVDVIGAGSMERLKLKESVQKLSAIFSFLPLTLIRLHRLVMECRVCGEFWTGRWYGKGICDEWGAQRWFLPDCTNFSDAAVISQFTLRPVVNF